MSPRLSPGFGGIFIGVILSAFLLGIITVQVFKYYGRFGKDRISSKIIVGVLWLLSIFNIGFSMQIVYWKLIDGYYFPHYDGPRDMRQMGVAEVTVVTTSVIVESFFVFRVYSLSSSILLSVFVESLVLVQFALGFAAAIQLCRALTSVQAVEQFIIPWLSLQAAADIVIAGTMSFLLRRQRTGFKTTDSVINRMALYALNTGTVTSVFGIAVLATSLRNGYWANVLATPFQNVYIVAMLASLHSRSGLQRELDSLETAGAVNLSNAGPTPPKSAVDESRASQGSSKGTPTSSPTEAV